MAKVLHCSHNVNKLDHQSLYCVRSNIFGKDMNPLISAVIDYLVSLLFFYMDFFGIR